MSKKYTIKHLKESHYQLINVVYLFVSKLENKKIVSKSYMKQVHEILEIAEKIEEIIK